MPKPKGGRGHTAPYETKLTRIPIPLAEQISELVERYQEFIAAGGEAFSPPPLLDAIADHKVVNELKAAIASKDQALDEMHREKAKLLLQWGETTKQRDELDCEVNSLHKKNGDLNLKIQELQQQLAEAQGEINFQESRWKQTDRMNLGLAQEIREVKSQLAEETKSKITPKPKKLSSGKIDPKLSVATSTIVNSIDKVVGKPVNNLEPLNLNKLAKRLGYQSHPHLSRTKLRADFTDLSRERDPDGIGWRYDVESKIFYPVQ